MTIGSSVCCNTSHLNCDEPNIVVLEKKEFWWLESIVHKQAGKQNAYETEKNNIKSPTNTKQVMPCMLDEF